MVSSTYPNSVTSFLSNSNDETADEISALTQSSAHAGDPVAAVARFLDTLAQNRRIMVGYSGGLDSHVLLVALHQCRVERPDLRLSAVHIDHGIQSESGSWSDHCRRTCRDLDIPIQVLSTTVGTDPKQGPEASARIVRYELFASILGEGDYLLLGQHADDQAETFLLQALRGSGPDGLASIPRQRAFAAGHLCRPLLDINRLELEIFARKRALQWVEDPSNRSSKFDRNFLRNEIIPHLRQRWPALDQTLSRSATRCGAASHLLLSVATEDLKLVRTQQGNCLNIPRLLKLGQERIFNTLRLWVRNNGLTLPRLQDLQQVEAHLLLANESHNGIVEIGGYQFRRYREQLYLLTKPPPERAFEQIWRSPFQPLQIPETGQTLTHSDCLKQGLLLSPEHEVQVRSRLGGELIKVGNPAYHKAVKKVLQEASIPPWHRDTIPLLYIDGRLAAIWDIAVSRDFNCRTA